MIIAKWFILGWLIASALLYVSKVGKPRETITSAAAVIGVTEYAALIVLIVVFWR